MSILDRHLHWLDQVAVGKVLSLNCCNDSMILHKARYVRTHAICTYDTDTLCVRMYICAYVCVCVYVCVFIDTYNACMYSYILYV